MRIEPGIPVSIFVDGTVRGTWSRVDLSDRRVVEDWLQQVVFNHPEVIPISLVDPSYGPLIPLGREVSTRSGPVDAMFMSPDGAISVLEAKLWRNPQARREVVGQIIDYAAAIAMWSFEDLDDLCRANSGGGLWDLVRDRSSFNTEHEFTDAVSRNLRKGRFLLLVVGDGIREEVERMTDYVQSAPQLQFSLALVELRLFERDSDGERLVVPSVVARTSEVTRAVVEVELADQAAVRVEVSVPAYDMSSGRQTITDDQFIDSIEAAAGPGMGEFVRRVKLEFESDQRFVVENKTASYVIKLREPGGAGPLTVLVLNKAGNIHPGWLGQQLPKAGIPADVGYRLVADLADIAGAEVNDDDRQWWTAARPLQAFRDSYQLARDRILEFADEVYSAHE